MIRPRAIGTAALGAIVAAALAVLPMSCSLIEGDDKDAGGATVRTVAFSTDTLPEGRTAGPGAVFPSSTREIRAVVTLEGVQTGMTVTGAWFQLGVAGAPPEGSEVNASDVVLDTTTVAEGVARVTFLQRAGQRGFPIDAWVLRVYVNGALVRTSGFVVNDSITGASAGPAPTQAPAQPTAGPAAAPTPRAYTVVAGDTVASVAQRFLPQGEAVAAYTTRLLQLNNLPAGAALQTGQVLRIP